MLMTRAHGWAAARRSALLLVAILVPTAAGLALAADDGPRAPSERRFTLTYSVAVRDLPAGAKRLRVWLPLAQSDTEQRVEARVTAPIAHRITEEPAHGNRMVYLESDAPAPLRASVAYEVTRREVLAHAGFRGIGARALSEQERARLAAYLDANRLVPTDGEIARRAARLSEGEANVLNRARRFYDDVIGAMRYDKSGEGWGRGDARWACDSGRGNCSDFHSVFIALARAGGVPARFEVGFPLPPARGEGRIGGYHCWARFYVAGHGWIPIDASEADKHPELREYYFGGLTEDRIAFSRGRDLRLEPAQDGDPVNFFVYPYVEVDGRAHEAVDLEVTYRDAAPAAAGAPAKDGD